MAVGYRVGKPKVLTAWKVLEHEYKVLGNEHIREDLARFPRLKWSSDPARCKWAVVLRTFRSRFGDVVGMWVVDDKRDARERIAGNTGPALMIESGHWIVINRPDKKFVLGPFSRMVGVKGMNPRGQLPYYNNYVNWPREKLEALEYIADRGLDKEVTREVFLKNVSMSTSEAKKLIPSWDYHIRYHRVQGYRIYFFVHSAIEHVYAEPSEIERLGSKLARMNPRKGTIVAKTKGKTSKKRKVAKAAGYSVSPVAGILFLVGLVWLAKRQGNQPQPQGR